MSVNLCCVVPIPMTFLTLVTSLIGIAHATKSIKSLWNGVKPNEAPVSQINIGDLGTNGASIYGDHYSHSHMCHHRCQASHERKLNTPDNPRLIDGFRALWDNMVRITAIETCINAVFLRIIPFLTYVQRIEHIVCLLVQFLDTTQTRWVMEWSKSAL